MLKLQRQEVQLQANILLSCSNKVDKLLDELNFQGITKFPKDKSFHKLKRIPLSI